MAPTQKPGARYPRARPPVAGSYSMPMLHLPGSMNMPKRAMGRKTGVIPSMKKMNRPK